MSYNSISAHEISQFNIEGPFKYDDFNIKGLYFQLIFRDIKDDIFSVSIHTEDESLLNRAIENYKQNLINRNDENNKKTEIDSGLTGD